MDPSDIYPSSSDNEGPLLVNKESSKKKEEKVIKLKIGH